MNWVASPYADAWPGGGNWSCGACAPGNPAGCCANAPGWPWPWNGPPGFPPCGPNPFCGPKPVCGAFPPGPYPPCGPNPSCWPNPPCGAGPPCGPKPPCGP